MRLFNKNINFKSLKQMKKISVLLILCLNCFWHFEVFSQTLGGGGGNTVECFSQSYTQDDFDYYDCGTCQKVDGRRGYGSIRLCNT